ncbi:MAG: hypothetical protein AB8B61_09720 [Cyclobacteriaceae bacterium]
MSQNLSLFFLASLLSLSLTAQRFSSKQWHKGTLYLTSGDSISSQVQYNFTNDVVFLNENGKLKTYSPVQINKLTFKDSQSDITRYFKKIEVKQSNGFQRPTLFEILYENSYSLLRKDLVYRPQTTQYSPFSIGSAMYLSQNTEAYLFFMLDKRGIIHPFEANKKSIYSLFPLLKEEVKTFIKNNKLKPHKVSDLISVFEYANSRMRKRH